MATPITESTEIEELAMNLVLLGLSEKSPSRDQRMWALEQQIVGRIGSEEATAAVERAKQVLVMVGQQSVSS